jgi:hypothetical protein
MEHGYPSERQKVDSRFIVAFSNVFWMKIMKIKR